MFRKLLGNHILANLTFLLVLVIGSIAYYQMPREQDPSINFNWVQIWAFWPGASATDVEKRITEPLEEGISNVQDVKFVSSSSREGISSILIRFDALDDDLFNKRIVDLRRELQAKYDELPEEVEQPDIIEISSSNAFPTATIAVRGYANDAVLQSHARNIAEDLQRVSGIDRVTPAGDRNPELKVQFLPERLLGLGISPVELADTVTTYFRDVAAGSIAQDDQEWLIRLVGKTSDPKELGAFPLLTVEGELPLRSVAEIGNGWSDPRALVRYEGQPAVLLSVFKKSKANSLDLLDEIKAYIDSQNTQASTTGVRLYLIDDQTVATRAAIGVMERNAIIGFMLVLLATWLFLGTKIAVLTSIGIPFVLTGTFWALYATGQTLNVTVLLGIVISLGMLVDDAIVMVEAMYYHIKHGRKGVDAALAALREVGIPVATAVLTTVAAFLPLMLLPGVLGDFMRVVPLVVTIALTISLIEAFWILPSHVIEFRPGLPGRGLIQRFRRHYIFKITRLYTKGLMATLRRPLRSLLAATSLLFLAVGLIATGLVRVDFFAADEFPLFYVNVEMPPGTSLEATSDTLLDVEKSVKANIKPDELRGIVNYSGQQITDREVLIGNERGQVFVSLNAHTPGNRRVEAIIDACREAVRGVPGPIHVSFLRRKTGPPTSKPINIKVRGDNVEEIRRASSEIVAFLEKTDGISDIADDDTEGGMEMSLRLDPDAITRAQIAPDHVIRTVRLFADGEIVTSMQHHGDKVDVRVRAKPIPVASVDDFLRHQVGVPGGEQIALGELLYSDTTRTASNIKHYNFRRALTITADLDSAKTDTLSANRLVRDFWDTRAVAYPGISLDLSGEMDDIQESINSMALLFLMGMGLIYLILGTQFKSYTQPVIVLLTVPMAFVGVVLGLAVSGSPLSLFTLYGVVALAGIGANDAIVLMSAINWHLTRGLTLGAAITYAARRRLLPIVITSITTIAGLFSLATGMGGKSLMWTPVATAIVWGLAFSTMLTLFVVPLSYAALLQRTRKESDEPDWIAIPNSARRSPLQRIAAFALQRLGIDDSREDGRLAAVLRNPELNERYQNGLGALKSGDLEQAIRVFQRLADDYPDVFRFHLLATQSLVYYMQKVGWDIGYIARAKKYFQNAKRMEPTNPDIGRLEEALSDLDAQQPHDTGQSGS